MCRNIKTLYNFEPPATGEEIRAAALQYVRKVSGFASPSAANRGGVRPRGRRRWRAASATLLGSLVTTGGAEGPRGRGREGARACAPQVRRLSPAMKVHLVDGTYELFRSHFGAPPREDAGGREVGATVGLLRSLWLLLSTPGRDARRLRLRPRDRVVPQRAVRRLQDERRRRPRPAGAVRPRREGGAGARPRGLADGGVRGRRRDRHRGGPLPRPARRRPGRALLAGQGPRAGGGRRPRRLPGTAAATSSWTRPA